jgi:hypothetical protein
MKTTHPSSTPILPPLAPQRGAALSDLWARMRAPRLDRELSRGIVSWRSRAHAARSLQLTGARSRRGLARALERLVDDCERPAPLFQGAVVQPCRPQVRESTPLMLEIASRLRSAEPVDARGVAMLRALVSDGAGPCYTQAGPGALTDALETISVMLDVHD